MIIVMKQDIGPGSDEVAHVKHVLSHQPEMATEVRSIKGATRQLTEVYVLGPTQRLVASMFEQIPGVERVIRLCERFRAIGRHGGQSEAVGFEYNGVQFTQNTFHVFAGVCAVDSRANIERTFRALQELGVTTTRAGAYKPRTSPYDFQGHGKECLPYVFELAGKYGIRVIAMEVTRPSHVDEIQECLRSTGNPTGVMVQIGTRNAQNFELLKEVGQQRDLPILFKRGMGITLEESLNACEYLAAGGSSKIIFGLRGMKTNLGDPHRNFVDFAHVPVVKRMTRLPVCIDPSHSVGGKVRAPDGLLEIHHVTAQGIIAGANMVLVDVHPRPEEAKCDGPQALLLEELPHFLRDCRLVRAAYEQRVQMVRESGPASAARVM